MQIKLAETAGFCMGVRRAMDCVLSEARGDGGPLYTLGPLIHNQQAVEMLEERGIRAIESVEGIHKGTLIIRAHGIPPESRRKVEDAGLHVVDATCPHVRYTQNVVRKHHCRGSRIVIVGDKEHAEVAGLLGFCDNEGTVVSSPQEARTLHLDGDICLVAQTTFNESVFNEIAAIITARCDKVEVVNTICRSTEERQREVIKLCESVDAMVVVGGKHSANTRRLAEIARTTGTPTVHVETAAELSRDYSRYNIVGVTAGASTPNWITASVLRRLEEIGAEQGKAARTLHRGLRFLTYSTVYTGLGAVALTYAAFALQGNERNLNPLYLVIAFCYIFSVHIWNRMGSKALDELGLPPRAAFHARHRAISMLLTLALAALSLMIVSAMGLGETLLLLAAYLIGLAYNIPLGPLGLKHRRLKDLPASKDIFTAIGWVTVGVIIPAISWEVSPQVPILAGAVAFILAFVRATMFDFTDIQGDRLLGRETLPVLIGPRRTRIILASLAGLLAAVLMVGAALGIFSSLGYWLLPCPLFIVLVLYPLFQRVVRSEIICPLVADGLLVFTGIVALLWHAA